MSALPTCPQPFVIAFASDQPDELAEIRKALHMATTELEEVRQERRDAGTKIVEQQMELAELKRRMKVSETLLCGAAQKLSAHAYNRASAIESIHSAIDVLTGALTRGDL